MILYYFFYLGSYNLAHPGARKIKEERELCLLVDVGRSGRNNVILSPFHFGGSTEKGGNKKIMQTESNGDILFFIMKQFARAGYRWRNSYQDTEWEGISEKEQSRGKLFTEKTR